MATRSSPSKGGKPDKLWRDALHRALKRSVIIDGGKPTKALELLADKVVMMGIDGNMEAITEIANRMDGKLAPVVQADLETGMTIIVDTGIRRDVNDVANPDIPKQITDNNAEERS